MYDSIPISQRTGTKTHFVKKCMDAGLWSTSSVLVGVQIELGLPTVSFLLLTR